MHEIVIYEAIKSQNTREKQHWGSRARDNKRWRAYVRAAMTPAERSQVVNVKRRVVITSIRGRLLDVGNLVGGAKGLVDALVQCGILVDDSPKWCEIEYHQRIKTKSETQKTIISWEDMQ
jgi:hypothetical protein